MPTRKMFPSAVDRRRKDAAVRQEASDALTPMQKLAQLDKSFGDGKGAVKERAKLAKKLAE